MYMETEVRRGATILDQQCPGWRQRVDLDKLNLTSSTNCVLGQLYGHYVDGGLRLGITDKPISHYGFAIPMLEDVSLMYSVERLVKYEELTNTWRTVIQEEPVVIKTFDPEPTVTPINWNGSADEVAALFYHMAKSQVEAPPQPELVGV